MTHDDVIGITLVRRWPAPSRALAAAKNTSIVVNFRFDSSVCGDSLMIDGSGVRYHLVLCLGL